MISGLFKNVIDKMCLEIIYLIYMYKKDLALNTLQGLICIKTYQTKHTYKKSIHTHTHTHTHIYIYIYIILFNFESKVILRNYFKLKEASF